jgi:hypothetical protein
VYDLDAVAYERGAGRKRGLPARVDDAARIATLATWVAEGIYLGWTDSLARAADAIVWLDVSWELAAVRIVRRHVAASMAGTNRHPGVGKLMRFLLATHRYYVSPDLRHDLVTDEATLTRAETAEWLTAFGPKVIRCRTAAHTARLVAAWNAPQARLVDSRPPQQ